MINNFLIKNINDGIQMIKFNNLLLKRASVYVYQNMFNWNHLERKFLNWFLRFQKIIKLIAFWKKKYRTFYCEPETGVAAKKSCDTKYYIDIEMKVYWTVIRKDNNNTNHQSSKNPISNLFKNIFQKLKQMVCVSKTAFGNVKNGSLCIAT